MEHRALALRRAAARREKTDARRTSAPGVTLSEQDRRPSGRHGHSERDAGLVLRRRPIPDADAAVAHAKSMAAQGCDIVDVGGESTRPGATPVLRGRGTRPHRAGLDARWRAISTCRCRSIPPRPRVAARAVELGAVMVNDVWGLQKDPAWPTRSPRPRRPSSSCTIGRRRTRRVDIVADMRRFFDRSLALAARAGIPRDAIILDPGIGFGKTVAAEHRGDRPPRRAQGLWPPDPGRRVAQGVSRLADRRSGIESDAGRHDGGQSCGGRGRRVALSRA